MSENDRERRDFVKEMYRVYWANMARSMEGIWKVLGPVTVVGTIIAAVHRDYLPAPLGVSLAFVVILWALNVTIDLNSWHRRNLFFLVKAERTFLKDGDYGHLLPVRYRTPQPNRPQVCRSSASRLICRRTERAGIAAWMPEPMKPSARPVCGDAECQSR